MAKAKTLTVWLLKAAATIRLMNSCTPFKNFHLPQRADFSPHIAVDRRILPVFNRAQAVNLNDLPGHTPTTSQALLSWSSGNTSSAISTIHAKCETGNRVGTARLAGTMWAQNGHKQKRPGPEIVQAVDLFGPPGAIRTHDPCLRRAVLYPAELRAEARIVLCI